MVRKSLRSRQTSKGMRRYWRKKKLKQYLHELKEKKKREIPSRDARRK